MKFQRLLKRARSVATGHVAISREALDQLMDRIEEGFLSAPKPLATELMVQFDVLDTMVLG